MKKYFDEKREIAGWIVAALGAALFCVALFVSAVPEGLTAVGAPMVVSGLAMVSAKFAAVADEVLEHIRDFKAKQDDNSEES